jgi:SAM-dependent methyltransferase
MSKILDFESPGTFDFAICVFTIISYITSPNDLRDSFAAVYRSIKPGGRFLLDIPSAILFRGGRHQSAEFDRTVTITPTNEHEFRFHQTIRWKRNEEVETIEDEFPLRYWPEDFVAGILEDVGFLQKTDLTSLFPETGARYWMLSRGN